MGVLSVIRYGLTRYPLQSTANKGAIIRICKFFFSAMFLYFTAKSLFPFAFGVRYYYSPILVHCDFYFDDLFERGSPGYNALFVSYLADFILPFIPVVAGCTGMVWVLLRKRKLSVYNTSNKRAMSARYSSTITVLFVIVTYVVFNVPVILVYSYQMLAEFSQDWETYHHFDNMLVSLYVLPTVLVISIGMNGAFNAAVYFVRIPELRPQIGTNRMGTTHSPITHSQNARNENVLSKN